MKQLYCTRYCREQKSTTLLHRRIIKSNQLQVSLNKDNLYDDKMTAGIERSRNCSELNYNTFYFPIQDLLYFC
jgi:hypothetical protein